MSLVARPPVAATLASLPIVFVGDAVACWLFRRIGLEDRSI